MHFLAPSLAGFLTLAAIPVILYLIFRYKKKDVPWGATYILRLTVEQKSRQNIWKQYVIILLRILALIALVVVFLIPYRNWMPPADRSFPKPPRSTHRLILLDTSSSMTAAFGSGSCFDNALSLCRKIVDANAYPGRLDILPLDGRDTPLTFSERRPDALEIEERIGDLQLTPGAVDFEKGLRSAVTIFRASHYKTRELYILSDFSANDLMSHRDYAGLVRLLSGMEVKLFCRSYQNDEANNFAVLDFSAGLDLLLAGQPTLFRLRLGYYGKRETAETWLTIRNQNGHLFYEEPVSLAQGEKTIDIPLTLTGGEQTLTVSLKADDYVLDNTLSRSFRVSSRLRLAVIQDIDLSKGFANPREWLQTAFSPEGGTRTAATQWTGRGMEPPPGVNDQKKSESEPIRVNSRQFAVEFEQFETVVDYVIASQLGPGLLADKDGVILLDVDTVPDDALDALRSYAIRGGLVFLAPGPNVDARKFNESFAGLAPAMLDQPARQKIEPDIYQNAVLESVQDRLLRELEAPQHGNISDSRFYNSYRLVPGSMVENSETLLSLSGEAPLLLRRPIGRGGSLLWTAGLGGDWHSMVVHPVYPIFFIRLLNLAASNREFALNLEPGAPIIRRVDALEVAVRSPGGQRISLKSILFNGDRYVRYDKTREPGSYILYPDPKNEAFTFTYHVRENRRESDYRTIAGNDREAFEQLIGSPLYATEKSMIHALGLTYEGTPLTVFAAGCLLLFLLLETALARRWFA